MLNPPIENDCKNDAIRKIDRCIFKTISESEKGKIKQKSKKDKIFDKILKKKAKEKYKENKNTAIKKDKQSFYKNKNKCCLNGLAEKEAFLFELVSANKDCILLKRKKLREKEENPDDSSALANSLGINAKLKAKPTKIKLNKLKNTFIGNENILDFDKILEEIFGENKPKDEQQREYSSFAAPLIASGNNSSKIKIETKLLIKGNLFDKLRKKDQSKLKIKKQKDILPIREKIAKIEKQTVIKIPNLLQKEIKPIAKLKEKSLKAELIKLKMINNEKIIENSDNVVKKIVKICKGKLKKFKKRAQRRDSNLYDINNFVVHNNSNKINERKDVFNIPIPVYKELADDFFSKNTYNDSSEGYFNEDLPEETNDEVYLKFHNVYEKRENDFRINFYKKKNQKQKCESFTPQENTSVHESNTIDSVIRINCNFLQEEGFLVK